MSRNWTFGRKVGAGFAVTLALSVVMAVIAIYGLRTVVVGKDRLITVDSQNLIDAERLHRSRDELAAATRGYFLTRQASYVDAVRSARTEILDTLGRLRNNVSTAEGRQLVEQIAQAEKGREDAIDDVIALRQSDTPLDAVVRAYDERVGPKRDELDRAVSAFVSLQERLLDEGRRASTETASAATTLVVVFALAAVLLASIVAVLLTRALGRQIGAAVGQVQSSSAELQAAANQQATGAKEQATAMNEISTTITELLATSRQIAEGSQRVAQIAEDTARSARTGDGSVGRAQESVAAIRKQVDLVVAHMLELGKKSQQIGAVLEIVSELAEQTNIVAINATIEAAGAGEAGNRFAVVANEIRRLADRVAGSTKEIRGLIEDVRSAVNTTVMATESGSKAVDSGSRQFGEVTSTFKQIADLVTTTAEAGREIELSTKQQATAVEQVKVAVANVAQATRENEASSAQTLQTASQLAALSKDLLRLVQARAAAA
jgi:CHASE3 domain sensor protein